MTEAILTIALAASVALNVVGAVLFSRRSSQSLALLDRAHERTTRYTEGLVDRLMAMDFGTFKAYQALEEAPEPEMEPEPDIPYITDGPDIGGFGSKLGLRALTTRRTVSDEDRVRATEELLQSELLR